MYTFLSGTFYNLQLYILHSILSFAARKIYVQQLQLITPLQDVEIYMNIGTWANAAIKQVGLQL